MAATGRLLVDLAKLGLDERSVRIQEAQVAIVALAEADLPDARQKAILVRVAELVAAADGEQVRAPRRLTV